MLTWVSKTAFNNFVNIIVMIVSLILNTFVAINDILQYYSLSSKKPLTLQYFARFGRDQVIQDVMRRENGPINYVYLFWWPAGETNQTNVYSVSDHLEQLFCKRKIWDPRLGEIYEIYVTSEPYISFQRMTCAIYAATYMGNIWL